MLSATKKAKQGEAIGNNNILVDWSGKASLRRWCSCWGLAGDNNHLLPLFPHGWYFSHVKLLTLLDHALSCLCAIRAPFSSRDLLLLVDPAPHQQPPRRWTAWAETTAPLSLCACLCDSQLCFILCASLCVSFPQQPLTSYSFIFEF